jgi:hypothetical protein
VGVFLQRGLEQMWESGSRLQKKVPLTLKMPHRRLHEIAEDAGTNRENHLVD